VLGHTCIGYVPLSSQVAAIREAIPVHWPTKDRPRGPEKENGVDNRLPEQCTVSGVQLYASKKTFNTDFRLDY
jgi:hypothetical protein